MKTSFITFTAIAMGITASSYAMKPTFYAGGSAGIASNTINTNTIDKIDTEFSGQALSGQSQMSSSVFEVEGGAKFVLSHGFAVSAGVFFGLNDLNQRSNSTVAEDNLLGLDPSTLDRRVSTPFNFGLVSRIGKDFEGSEVYGLVGLGLQSTKNRVDTAELSDQTRRMPIFIRVGAGMEKSLSSNIRAYMEYTYDIALESNNLNNQIADNTVKINTGALRVGARYFFSY